MRYDSAARLAHLEGLHKAKSAAARDAQRRRNELAAAATAARDEAERAEAEAEREEGAIRAWKPLSERIADAVAPSKRGDGPGQGQSDETAKAKAIRLRARSDELDAALAQADQQAAATRDAATDAGRLYAACVDFARAEGLPFPVTTKLPGADPLAGVQAQGAFR